MEYNTKRSHLYMPEYGRLIQSLVEHCKTLTTKEERNEIAHSIISFIGQRNPHLRSEENYKHKLWDHLFILADYDLDVDSPYPIPTREEMQQKPKKIEYPSYDNEYKFYGKSILQLIDKAIALPEGEEKETLIQVIANNMKKSYNVYNKEHVQDEVIFRHLKELSKNQLYITGIDSLEKSKIYHSNNHRNKNQNHKNNQQKRKNFQNHKNNRKN
ncbi:DUF4290 domain-containing protein [Elizabethkingia argentiflava]|uniref:DUF4290 domain-containing protein n=1 Tax=Elizabethkingia argenteiflava TaxID=2681556 RepID=A0A845PVK6_9FLAO|nr:DUF4290 domain-containing protein [Elizabethkingia argenteiflava]NAW50507.1 DUF4290 domain-containing protein [Elizabethkingia argenteiflava]